MRLTWPTTGLVPNLYHHVIDFGHMTHVSHVTNLIDTSSDSKPYRGHVTNFDKYPVMVSKFYVMHLITWPTRVLRPRGHSWSPDSWPDWVNWSWANPIKKYRICLSVQLTLKMRSLRLSPTNPINHFLLWPHGGLSFLLPYPTQLPVISADTQNDGICSIIVFRDRSCRGKSRWG